MEERCGDSVEGARLLGPNVLRQSPKDDQAGGYDEETEQEDQSLPGRGAAIDGLPRRTERPRLLRSNAGIGHVSDSVVAHPHVNPASAG